MRERRGDADRGSDHWFAGNEAKVEFGGIAAAGCREQFGELPGLCAAGFVGRSSTESAQSKGRDSSFPNRGPCGVAAVPPAGVPI